MYSIRSQWILNKSFLVGELSNNYFKNLYYSSKHVFKWKLSFYIKWIDNLIVLFKNIKKREIINISSEREVKKVYSIN